MADTTVDPTGNTEEEQPGAESTETEGQEEQAEETTEVEEEPEEDPANDLPEWAQKELTKARQEAARYRTSLRDAEKKLAEAKTQEDIDAAVADVRNAAAEVERDLLIERAIRSNGLTDDDLEFFEGIHDSEAIEARAKKLAARTSQNNGDDIDDLRGGLDPSRRRNDREMNPESVQRIIPRGRTY